MKNVAVWFGALLLGALSAGAQIISVQVLLESEQYVPNEPLIAKVRINNSSGQTLRLGDDPNWLTFVIESHQGPYVRMLKLPDVMGGFELESSHTATKHVDLAPCFDLSKIGRYNVTATVRAPGFTTAYASPTKWFHIANGKPLKEMVFGTPANIAPAGPDGEPEVRKYILVQAQSGYDSKLYARVTDRYDNNIKVVPLGTLISFSKPVPQLDKWSNLHVLFETGGRTFSYSAINPDGLLIARETHEYSDTKPTLGTTDEGRILVHGGQRRPAADDVPPMDTAQLLPSVEDLTTLPATNSAPAKVDKKAGKTVNAKEKKKR